MVIWLIRKSDTHMCFEKAFETERDAQRYIAVFGNDTWSPAMVYVETAFDIAEIEKAWKKD